MPAAPLSLRQEIADWAQALSASGENPVQLRLAASRKRRWQALHPLRRGLPLVLAAIPTLVFCGIAGYDQFWGRGNDSWTFFQLALSAFVLVAYISWAVGGLAEAVLDVMSFLSHQHQQSFRMQLDDMTAITGLTDIELAAGVLRTVLPPLFLRVAGGSAVLWLGFLLARTEFLTRFDQDISVLVATAPLIVANWTLFGCLGLTILLLYLLQMGNNHWKISAPVAVGATLLSQGIWLIFGTAMAMAMIMDDFVRSGPGNNGLFWLSLFVSPLLFFWLVYRSLDFCRAYPRFRLLYGAIGPLTNPLLLAIAAAVLFGVWIPNVDLDLAAIILPFTWHFGDMLPLNPPTLVMPVLLTGDWNQPAAGVLVSLLQALLVLLTQLALLLVCARHVRLVINLRRQGDEG